MAINFAPKVANSRTPFIKNESSIEIYFEYPNTPMGESIVGMEYTVVKSDTNTTAFTPGASYRATSIVPSAGKTYISIPTSEISGGWKANVFYRINLRFYGTSLKSEWSTSCYVKALSDDTIESTSENYNNVLITAPSTYDWRMTSDSPSFFGKWVCDGEPQSKYQFILLDDNKLVLEDSDLLPHSLTQNYDTYCFNTSLENGESYNVLYRIISKNGYIKTTGYFNFKVLLQDVSGFTFTELIATFNRDNALNLIKIAAAFSVRYDIVLKRASSKTNYIEWEDLSIFKVTDNVKYPGMLINFYYNDFLIESGISYKYGLQAITETFRGPRFEISEPIKVFYDDAFLVSKGKQLKLGLNLNISSFKTNRQKSIQLTLGSKYPFVFVNPIVDYKSFQIGGLISFNMDNDKYFLEQSEFLTETGDTFLMNVDTLLTDSNIKLEFLFREKVSEFLNNSDFKLFKSPTEGFLIVDLSDINFSPFGVTNRALYDFSGTATEVSSASISNLCKYEIVTIEPLMSLPTYIQQQERGTCHEPATP